MPGSRPSVLDADSLERLVPDEVCSGETTGEETYRLHLERYAFAAGHCPPGRILDLACGVGYGTRYLADNIDGVVSVTGVDVSAEAVAYAMQRYAGPGTEFLRADAMSFDVPEPFDAAVSLETIEHLQAPLPFVRRLVELVRPGGLLVTSVPTTPSVDVNPHHLHDFTERSFRRLFTDLGCTEVAAFPQAQPVPLSTAWRRNETRMAEMRPNLLGWYARHPASLMRRVGATLRHGLTIKYLTVAWRLP